MPSNETSADNIDHPLYSAQLPKATYAQIVRPAQTRCGQLRSWPSLRTILVFTTDPDVILLGFARGMEQRNSQNHRKYLGYASLSDKRQTPTTTVLYL